MHRINVGFAAILIVAGTVHAAAAQTTAPPAATTAKPSKMKLTAERLKEMKAHWSVNKGKLKACRKQVRSKGLAGDDRWFFMEDCMNKT
jgi:hypothetical protein